MRFANFFSMDEMLKELLEQGDVAAYMEQKGQAFTLSGKVVEGNKVGRTLGYPTANLKTDDISTVLPAQGVYIARVNHENAWYDAMVNIGIRPTLDMDHVTIEAHLFDFNKNIYGHTIRIAFLDRIRDEMRFNSLAELKKQLDEDAKTSKNLLQQVKWS